MVNQVLDSIVEENKGKDITDRINMYIDATSEYKENIKDYLDMIKDETLTINVYDKDGIEDKVNINDYEVGFVLEKVSTK